MGREPEHTPSTPLPSRSGSRPLRVPLPCWPYLIPVCRQGSVNDFDNQYTSMVVPLFELFLLAIRLVTHDPLDEGGVCAHASACSRAPGGGPGHPHRHALRL